MYLNDEKRDCCAEVAVADIFGVRKFMQPWRDFQTMQKGWIKFFLMRFCLVYCWPYHTMWFWLGPIILLPVTALLPWTSQCFWTSANKLRYSEQVSYLCYKLQAPSRQQDHQGLAVRGGQQCQAHRLHIAGHCCQPQAAATMVWPG